MDEWIDLAHTIAVHGWATNSIITVSSEGSGKAILLSLLTQDSDQELEIGHFLIDPSIAHAIGFELIACSSGYEIPPTLNDQTVAIEGHSILDDLRSDDE